MNVQEDTEMKSTFRYYKQFYIFISKAKSQKKGKITLKSSKGNSMRSCVYYPKMLVFILKVFRSH